MRSLSIILAAAAGLAAAAPLPAFAQSTVSEPGFVERAPDDDDDDVPWGVLGLLGLGGLLRKRREPGIHVDARHTKSR